MIARATPRIPPTTNPPQTTRGGRTTTRSRLALPLARCADSRSSRALSACARWNGRDWSSARLSAVVGRSSTTLSGRGGRRPRGWSAVGRCANGGRARPSWSTSWRDSCPAPLECDFRTGIVHLNDNPDQEELFSVVRAFATHKMHYLGLLRTLLHGLSFRDKKLFDKSCPGSSLCLWREPRRRVCGACAPCVGRAARRVSSDNRAPFPQALVQQARR